ncbi:MAG: long-chain fatty acid--CoA ligase [Acidimicrobiia bacterium]|nr:long-chain fatty acid--CoA ligase [Acidimicrobiia bacterium]
MNDRNLQSERRRIDQAVEGLTLVDLLDRAADNHPERPAARWQDGDGEWASLTWEEMRAVSHQAAAGLQTMGTGKGDFVGIMAGVRPEHAIADLAIVHTGAVPITFYDTLASPQIAYIGRQAGVKVAILENKEVMERWETVRSQLPALEHVVLLDASQDDLTDGVTSWEALLARGAELLASDPDTVTRSASEVTPSDLATLIYTSGTTGHPKGVMITHRNVAWTAECIFRTLNMPDHVRTLAYLPFAHIATRAGTHYIPIHAAGETYYCPDITAVADYARACRPQAFLGVPRVWEKFQARLLDALEADPKRRDLVMKAIANGKAVVEGRVSGKKASLGSRIKHALFDRIIFSKIRARLGMDELQLAVTAAAPISRDLLVFFHALGVPLYEVYGMSENTGPSTCTTPDNPALGTVGRPFLGVEVETVDDGEIRVRGGVVTAGYYRMPQETSSTFSEDGWLYSGDLGEWDDAGNLKVVGRKKEIIITSSGKNVAPATLETALSSHPLVAGVCMVGDNRPYLTILVSLDPQETPPWAEQRGIATDDWASLTSHPEVVEEITSTVEEANRMVARAEQVKKTAIVPDVWAPDSGEITPTMKVRRHAVLDRYSDLIDGLYEDETA